MSTEKVENGVFPVDTVDEKNDVDVEAAETDILLDDSGIGCPDV